MTSMAERGGKDRRTSNGAGGGGAGQQQQQQQPRIVVPGSRVVDGRTAVRGTGASGPGSGGKATATMSAGSRESERRDMEARCREICTILKDCKVGAQAGMNGLRVVFRGLDPMVKTLIGRKVFVFWHVLG